MLESRHPTGKVLAGSSSRSVKTHHAINYYASPFVPHDPFPPSNPPPLPLPSLLTSSSTIGSEDVTPPGLGDVPYPLDRIEKYITKKEASLGDEYNNAFVSSTKYIIFTK